MRKFNFLSLVIFVFFPAVYVHSASESNHYIRTRVAYLKSDKELNSLYKNQMREYQREGAEFYGQNESRDVYLKKAQQAWIKMRDASCDYETYESRKGTAFSSIYEQCLLDKTNERIKYLNENN